MIVRRFFTCSCLFCWALVLLAQKEHLEYGLIDETDPTGWIHISTEMKPGIRGQQYLFVDWKLADLVLSNGDEKKNIYLNYDLENQTLEIASQQGIKIVPGGLIKQFSFNIAGEIRSFIYSDFSAPCLREVDGYQELLFKKDEIGLVLSRKMLRKNPTYNEKLGIGDNNVRLISEEHLWLFSEKNCIEIRGSAGKRKKQLIQFFRSSQIDRIVNENHFNLKNPADCRRTLEIWFKDR